MTPKEIAQEQEFKDNYTKTVQKYFEVLGQVPLEIIMIESYKALSTREINKKLNEQDKDYSKQ